MKRLLLALLAITLYYTAWAIPALPVRRTVTLSDGTRQVVTLQGDEHFSFYRLDDGRKGLLSDGGRFELLSEDKFQARIRQAQSMHKVADARRSVRAAMLCKSAQRRIVTVGQRRGLVILVSFEDLDFSIDDPNGTYQRFFNEEGYSDDGMSGSVHDYFRDQSYGQFDLSFDVYGPVKLSRSYTFYGRNDKDSKDVNVHSMITEALRTMDGEIDYSKYDWDEDGAVDQVFFIYAGYCEAQGAEENTIWPHESSIESAGLVLDGKRLGTYGCSGELMGTTGTHLDGIGTACHEFTHCLGLPDFYDTGYTGGYGMASWDLMSAGSYNNNSRTPAGYTSYERWVAGWMEPTELTGAGPIRIEGMNPIQTAPEAYVLYNDKTHDEFYLIENRQPVGWDGALPGHGLLVLHVDYDEASWKGNTLNCNPKHQRLTVVPADNNTLENVKGMAGDPYPGTSENHNLTNYTTPAATLFNKNKDRTFFLNKPLNNIQESTDGLISFVALHPELDVPDAKAEKESTTSFLIRWQPVEYATAYELELTETPASKHDLTECLLMKEDFPKCVTASAGFSDVSGRLSNYLSNQGWTGSKLYTSPKGLRFGTSSEAGYLRTAGYQIPESGEVTLVLDLAPFAEGTAATGEVRFVYNSRWDTYQSVAFSVDKAGRYLLQCSGLEGVGAIDIRPESRLYITYLALYEGHWTDEELAATSAKAECTELVQPVMQAPRRISTQKVSTSETMFRVAEANPTSTYTFSIRALTDEGIVSLWSEKQSFRLDDTGISSPSVGRQPDSGQWFDLSGRRIAMPTQPGIYVRGGRKTAVR